MGNRLLQRLVAVRVRVRYEESGLTTAELLGNAALGVFALVLIWTAMRQLGVDVVDWIRGQLLSQG